MAFKHASVLEMTSDRNHFTKHGLHLNGLGKEVLSKQIVSHVCEILLINNKSLLLHLVGLILTYKRQKLPQSKPNQ